MKNNKLDWTLAFLYVLSLLLAGLVGSADAHVRHHHELRRHPPVAIVVYGNHHIGTFHAGALAGRQMRDLYGVYVGHIGVMPAVLSVDYSNALRDLWYAKLQTSRYNPEIKRIGERVIREYDAGDAEHMTLAKYEGQAGEQAPLLCGAMDWARLGRGYFGNSPAGMAKARLLRNIACMIGGRELVAYSMTELMPGEFDGAFNRDTYDFLLRSGGRRYIESVPAAYDHMISYGPYQFTSFALYDNGHVRRGASIPNQALPGSLRIGGNVISLRGNDHFRAAYLFAVNNEAELLRRLNAHELAVLERGWRGYRADLMVYIATAHHLPFPAIKAARRWLDHDARLAFYRSCGGGLTRYAIKSMRNYSAL